MYKHLNSYEKFSVRVELVRDSIKKGPIVSNPSDIAELVKNLGKKDREYFLAIHLDARNSVLGIETVSIGSANASLVHPRELFKGAILNSAISIVLVHNHPSGNLIPSAEDMEITDKLVSAGNLLGIPVLDHIIIGHTGFLSMKEENLIKGGTE